ncbi:hypothetical protein DV737_g1076, partial [Chaetothyriales sp. CBS 132003]
MSAATGQQHAPYAPQTASVGGLPTVGVDVPICAVFIAIYLGAAIGHMSIFQLNRRRNHRFVLSALMFGFCMARIVTMVMRIVWACYPHNVRVAIAANIFVNAGILILFIVDLLFAQRILRATHPRFGWHKTVTAIFTVLYVLIVFMLAIVITSMVQSAYTLNSNIHRIDRDLQMTAVSYLLFFSFLPIPLVVIGVLVPRRHKLDQFGSGKWRTKILVLLTGTTLLLLGSSFRAATVFKNPRPRTDPAWYHAKSAFYLFNFTLEIIVIYLYLAARVDQRFHIPDGAKGPGDYSQGQPGNAKVEHALAGGSDTEVAIDQSYGYGARGALRDADHIGPGSRLVSKESAINEIDADVEDALGRFQDRAQQVQQDLDAPSSRTRRKTSRGLSREPSVDPDKEKSSRVAAWADAIESDQLGRIPEEARDDEDEDEEVGDDESRKDTEPSSFPSGIFDASYNFERGLRKPRQIAASPKSYQRHRLLERIQNTSRSIAEGARDRLVDILTAILDLLRRMLRTATQAVLELPELPAFATSIKVLFTACLVAGASMLFCFLFSRLACDPHSTSIVSQNLQKICGSCGSTTSMPPIDLSGLRQQDVSALSNALHSIQNQINILESRLGQKFDLQQAGLEAEVESLKQQQVEMSTHIASLQVHHQPASFSSDGIASPLLPRVNFFAPSNGAIVNPGRSSPTKAKAMWLMKRAMLRALGITQTVAKGPMTALEPWQDVGDCWCAASRDQGDYIRLHVTTQEYIYPTELVVEHFPFSGSLNPGTAPKDLELWASVSEMSDEERRRLRIAELQENNSVLGRDFVRLGVMKYDASSSPPPANVNHVQSFGLDANRRGAYLMVPAKEFVLRVTSTYGADNACLYRVRLHGQTVEGGQ